MMALCLYVWVLKCVCDLSVNNKKFNSAPKYFLLGAPVLLEKKLSVQLTVLCYSNQTHCTLIASYHANTPHVWWCCLPQISTGYCPLHYGSNPALLHRPLNPTVGFDTTVTLRQTAAVEAEEFPRVLKTTTGSVPDRRTLEELVFVSFLRFVCWCQHGVFYFEK